MRGNTVNASMPIKASLGGLQRLKDTWFGSSGRTVVSVPFIAALVLVGPGLLSWLLFDATFFGDATSCRLNACLLYTSDAADE